MRMVTTIIMPTGTFKDAEATTIKVTVPTTITAITSSVVLEMMHSTHTQIFHHDGIERNAIQQGRGASLVDITQHEFRLWSFNELNIFASQSTSDK